MEEDIKTIQEKLKIIESLCTDDCINKSTVIQPLIYAIQNLIARYKKLEEENKELKSDNYELNNRINDLLDLDTQKDKLIDWLVEEIHSIVNLGEFIDNNINKLETKGEIKKYFEDRCK